MKTRIVVAITLIAASSTAFAAPQGRWSAEQQEIVDHLFACWNARNEALEKNKPEMMLDAFQFTDDAARWYAQDGTPQIDIRNATLRDWDATRTFSRMVDLRPVVVTVHGDVAVVHYYVYRRPKDDPTKVAEQKYTDVFKKSDRKWRFIGGHVTTVGK
jgi:hypothetical protein